MKVAATPPKAKKAKKAALAMAKKGAKKVAATPPKATKVMKWKAKKATAADTAPKAMKVMKPAPPSMKEMRAMMSVTMPHKWWQCEAGASEVRKLLKAYPNVGCSCKDPNCVSLIASDILG